MKRQTELVVITLLLVLAFALRSWDLASLSPGFSTDELAYIRMTEMVRDGDIAIHYQIGDDQTRAGMYAVGNALFSELTGDGLLGYRLFALWGGMAALAALYLLARRLFGPTVGLVAVGVMSVNLRAIMLARSATSEVFVPLYVLLTFYVLAVAVNLHRSIRFRAPQTLPFVLLAVAFGLSGTLHHTLLVLGPLGAIFFVHLLLTRQPISRGMWNAGIFVIVLATVVALPYLISTLRQPSASESYVLWAERPGSVGDVVDGALHAVGGVFLAGDERITHNVPRAALIGPLMSVLLLVGLVRAARQWRDPRYALLLLALAAGLLTDTWAGTETNYSENLVALPAIVLLVALGVQAASEALHTRQPRYAGRTVAAGVVVLLAVNVIGVRERLFNDWRQDDTVAEAYHADIGRVARYLDRTADGPPVSLCAVDFQQPAVLDMTPRDMLDVMLHSESLELRYSDCETGLVFINGGAEMRFVFLQLPPCAAIRAQLVDTWPPLGAWLNTEGVMPDPALLAMRDTLSPALSGWLAAGGPMPVPVWYEVAGMRPELARWLAAGEPVPIDGLPTATVLHVDIAQDIADEQTDWSARSLYFHTPDRPMLLPAEVPVTLEYNLTFKGYELAGGRVPNDPRHPIVFVTAWRVDGPLPRDMGLWAELLILREQAVGSGVYMPDTSVKPEGARAANISVRPAELAQKDVFLQVLYLPLPYLSAGDYAIGFGAYDGTSQNRVRVLDRTANGQARGMMLWLDGVPLRAPLGN